MPHRLTPCLVLILAAATGWSLEEADLRDEATKAFVIRYALEVPADIPEGRLLPLIVCFHGKGGQATHHARLALDCLDRLGLRDQAIVLGAKSQAEGWEQADHEPVSKLIEWAKATLPVDPRRVYTHGMSSGGSMCGGYTLSHPEQIAAGVVYGSGFSTHHLPPAREPVTTHPDLYIVMGQQDDDAHKNHGARTTRWLTENGFQHMYRYPEDLAHTPRHPVTNDDSTRWLLRQRHKTMPPPQEDMDLLRAVARPARDEPTSPEQVLELARIGGPAGAAALATVLKGRDHDLQLAALQAALDCCFGDGIHALIAKRCLRSKDPGVQEAAIAVLAQDAVWRYGVALEAVTQVAFDRRADTALRRTAVDGLITAGAMQIRGNYQDPALFVSLVKLLDDDDAGIRTAVHALLKQAHDSPYDPAADDRGRGLQSFQAWVLDLKPVHEG